MPTIRFITLSVFLLLLTGCIIIPFPIIPEELPFDERIAFIEPGITTRQQVQKELGPPSVSRANDQINLYAKARTVAGLFVIYIGAGDIPPIETFHFFIIQYKADGVVKSADVIRNDESCTPEGICFIPAYTVSRDKGVLAYETVLTDAILFARREEDITLKSFPVLAEHCSIYLYYVTKSRMLLSIYRPDRETTQVNEEGYLHWIKKPGIITVKADITYFNHRYGELDTEVSTKFELDCEPGEIYFLKATYDWFGDNKLTFSMDRTRTGKQLVNERRLIIE